MASSNVSSDLLCEYVYFAMPETPIDPSNVQGATINSYGMVVLTIAQGVGGSFSLPASTFVFFSGSIVYQDFCVTPQAFISWYNTAIGANGASYPMLENLYNTVNGPSAYPTQYTSWIQQNDDWLTMSGFYWLPYSGTIATMYTVASNINTPVTDPAFGTSTAFGGYVTTQLYCLIRSVSNSNSVTQTTTGAVVIPETATQSSSQVSSLQTFTQQTVTASTTTATTGASGNTAAGQIAAAIQQDLTTTSNSISNGLATLDQDLVKAGEIAVVVGVVAVLGYAYINRKKLREKVTMK